MRGYFVAWIIGHLFTCGFIHEETSKKGHPLAVVVIVSYFVWPIILGEELADIVKKENPAEAAGRVKRCQE